MSDLVAFLRSCLDADEQAAQDAERDSGHPEWESSELSDSIFTADTGSPVVSGPYDYLADGLKAHIALFDPQRLLAEVESKRKILDRYERVEAAVQQAWAELGTGPDDEAMERITLEWVVKQMTLPYADRPGYDPAWDMA